MVAIQSVAELLAAHERFVDDLHNSLMNALDRGEVPCDVTRRTVFAALSELRIAADSVGIAHRLLAKVGG